MSRTTSLAASSRRVQAALWQIYDRAAAVAATPADANLPWDDPEFSARMLREHLDQSHGAASRQLGEIDRQIDVMWRWLDLRAGARILDVTCGPGLYAVRLAQRGCTVHGIDFSPAAIAYARDLAAREGVAERCRFTLADVREAIPQEADVGYDAALFIYGQLSVFTRDDTAALLRGCARSLRPGGRLIAELLDFERLDRREHNSWWYTDRGGLWGDFPYLHLGERDWDAEQNRSVERFFILNLETGEMHRYGLVDHGYPTASFLDLCQGAGFARTDPHPAWDSLGLYDSSEWMVYVCERQP